VIDHVVMAVRDLDDAGDRLLRDHGLASVPGGRHARWGTANRIVPLGEDYIELIGVVDGEQAARTVKLTAYTDIKPAFRSVANDVLAFYDEMRSKKK